MTETNTEAIQILKDYKNGVWIETHILEKSLQTVIEQAGYAKDLEEALKNERERVERLNQLNTSLSEESRGNFQAVLDYRRENKRLREALEFYADKKTYNETKYTEKDWLPNLPIDIDSGSIARQALEGVSNDQTLKT